MTAPTLPFYVYAICAGSGPVVIGRYESESEQRTAYALLWAFVEADDAMQAHDLVCDGSDPQECQRFGNAVVAARDALRKYETGTPA